MKPSLCHSYPYRLVSHLLRRYAMHDVGRQAAALAYYLLFTLFPFLIFLSSLLGSLPLDIDGLLHTLEPLVPQGVLSLLTSYFSYVSHSSNRTMLWFGLVCSIYFPMRAANCLMRAVRRAYHLPRPKSILLYQCKVLLYTICLLFTMVLSLILTTMGRRAITLLVNVFHLSLFLVELWEVARFLVLALVIFAALGLLYAMAQDSRRPAGHIVPGVLTALSVWLLSSAFYSQYILRFSNYSVIYGALGAVVILLVWLYLAAVILIMGAELNDALLAMKSESTEASTKRRRL